MKKIILSSLALVLFVSGLANGRTITVRLDGTGDYTTIQDAIDDCNDGDTVIVAPGTYTGNGNRDIDFRGKAITVRSTDPNDPNVVAATVIDCQASSSDPHRGFYFHKSENVNSILDGFTITNGYAKDYGGGIYCTVSSPTITNCIISNNMAYYGGGIGCRYGNPIITGCTIIGNTANAMGGGIICIGGGATISNCTINGNSAGAGGGVSCSNNSSATINNCTIMWNSAGFSGGGIDCGWESIPTITNCTITANTSGSWGGGGVSCHHYSSPTITNCVFNGNIAQRGGGILCIDPKSKAVTTNCTFSGNSASEGGGIYCGSENTATIINCTIVGNRADQAGGGIYTRYGSTPTISNSILWGNEALNGPEIYLRDHSNAWLSYTDIEGGWEGDGNIDNDPLFVSPGYWADANDPNIVVEPNDPNAIWVDGDYHLFKGSECIDTGTNNPAGGLPVTDLDGKPRPFDGDGDGIAIADMGAYEYPVISRKPVIRVEPRKFELSAEYGGERPEPQVLLVWNPGVRPLHWEIVEDCNWLEAIPTSSTSTNRIGEVILTVDPGLLSPGNYSCILKVCDPAAVNNPVTVWIKLLVRAVLRVPAVYGTIQEAIDDANDYDMVLVANGEYSEIDIDFRGKQITVRSENGPNNCVIDCKNSGRAFYFHSGETSNSIVEGFTLTNGNEHVGGAVYCYESSPTITNCIISGNRARDDGGGIFCWHSSPMISNCIISDNSANYGGGIYSRGESKPTITNCTISGNSAVLGGGVYCVGYGDATIADCIISGNRAEIKGGGIATFSSLTINNCTITGNMAGECGGGIRCRGSWNLTTITDCILWDNKATYGPEIYLEWSSTAWVSYSDIRGGDDGVYVAPDCTLSWEEGNIKADPCFVEPGYWDANDFWVDGDYHLLEDSPCIDAGDPNFVPEPGETDIDGELRVMGGRVDMGAYEAVVPPIEVAMQFTPQALNPDSKGKWVKAHFVLPEGFVVEDVDANTPAVIEPLGIESDYINVFINEEGLVEIEAAFSRSDFCGAAISDGTIEVTVVGLLSSGQEFYGTDTIRIINNNLRYVGVLASHWLEADCGRPGWCSGADVDRDSVVNFVDFALFKGCCIEVIKN